MLVDGDLPPQPHPSRVADGHTPVDQVDDAGHQKTKEGQEDEVFPKDREDEQPYPCEEIYHFFFKMKRTGVMLGGLVGWNTNFSIL